MTMLQNTLGRFSTKVGFETIIQLLLCESPTRIRWGFDRLVRSNEKVSPNIFNETIKFHSSNNPTKNALWNADSQKLTFKDLYHQSNQLANILTGDEYNLREGNTVLAMLPNDSRERILLQLACLQSGLVFCPYDPKDLTGNEISKRIQKLAVDCIITNENHLETACTYTHNPLRPLKKGLVTNSSSSKPLPVGWNHLLQTANDAGLEYTKEYKAQPDTPVIRLLLNNHLIQYSQKEFLIQMMNAACWLNPKKRSRLIWMKDQNEILSIAPWLFGSTIFLKQTTDAQNLVQTLESYPIDSLCASASDYEMLDEQQRKIQTQLEQLFASESVDSMARLRWYSLTNLSIRDDYIDPKRALKHKSSLDEMPSHEIEFSMAKPFMLDRKRHKVEYQLGGNLHETQRPHASL